MINSLELDENKIDPIFVGMGIATGTAIKKLIKKHGK